MDIIKALLSRLAKDGRRDDAEDAKEEAREEGAELPGVRAGVEFSESSADSAEMRDEDIEARREPGP